MPGTARVSQKQQLSFFLPSRVEVNSLIFVWVLRPVVYYETGNDYSLFFSQRVYSWFYFGCFIQKGHTLLSQVVSVTRSRLLPVDFALFPVATRFTSCRPLHENLLNRCNLSLTTTWDDAKRR